MFKDELFSRVRARRDSDDDNDDIGLPHSPCTSPTTVDVLSQGLKGKPLKSGSLSAGSLISMGSSENDEDSAVASSSGNSSRMSLLDRRSLDFEGDPDFHQPIPLNHNAAHHKIAVRPKRTHGLPQKRLKQQLAASRLNTLPTTPEVTEDNGKMYLKSEFSESTSTGLIVNDKLETTSTSTENTFSECVIESTTESSSAKQTSHMQYKTNLMQTSVSENSFQSSLTSSTNVFESGFVHLTDSSSSNSTEIQKSQKEDLSKPEDSLKSTSSTTVGEAVHSIREFHKDCFQSFTESLTSVSEGAYTKSTLLSKSDFNLKSIKDDQSNDGNASLQEEAPLRVSALIKSIERSDSMNKRGNDLSLKIGTKQSSAKSEVGNFSHELGENLPIQTMNDISDLNLNVAENLSSSSEQTSYTGSTNLSKSKDKISPVVGSQNEQSSVYHSFSESQLQMEIRQQFQQQKNAKNQEQHHGMISDCYPEEESIMSDKYVPSRMKESTEDSCVIVSHQITGITEAHNLVTVDKSFNMSMQNVYAENGEESSSKATNSDTWVSPPDSNVSNVMVNSLTSNVYSQKVNDDKVTISINSTSDDLKSNISEVSEKGNEVSNLTTVNMVEEKKISQSISANSQTVSNYSSKPSRPEGAKPPLKEKSVARTKNVDTSKRVSVEIVPFSQRMKDRKYQPLIFPNKSATTESTKGSPSIAVVERNLSDRRINTKNKDTDKSNRHSFSGALPVEVEKSIIEKKQALKSDKVHYPVQIRIHKCKTYEKENRNDKVKINKETKKSPSPEPTSDAKHQSQSSKTANEVKHATDIQAKWEVKVQSTSLVKTEISEPYIQRDNEALNSELANKPVASSNSIINDSEYGLSQSLISQKDISDKISPPSSLTESSSQKSRENARKSTRDTPPSEDPEPELLRVFARRSIKQKHCDKEKSDEQKDTKTNIVCSDTIIDIISSDGDIQRSNQNSSATPPPRDSDSQELFKSTLKSPDLVKKKSKSFCEKEKPGPHFITPVKETGVIRRPSLKATSPEISEVENFHRRQRLASEPDVMPILPPGNDSSAPIRIQPNTLNVEGVSLTCRSEHLQRGTSLSTSPSSTLSNGTSSSMGIDNLKGKENPDASAPSWLQLAQQRRELREQRERLLIGSSTNSFLDASSKPSRSSKVWDMVNNFQKMQMT